MMVPGSWDWGSLIAWSTDGQWLAFNGKVGDEYDVYVVQAAGGEPHMVQMPDRGGHSWGHRLSLSPDGQILAFSALELGKPRAEVPDIHNCYIYTIPTIGGEAKQISSGSGPASNAAKRPAFSAAVSAPASWSRG